MRWRRRLARKDQESDAAESAELLELLYRQMLLVRRFEEKCNVAYRQGKIGGYMHVYIGMEATAVGWLERIRPDWDYVITAYRDHAQSLIMSADPVATMAEIMGREGGFSGGKAGSMHLYDVEHGFFGGWGIVGQHVGIGAGLAFAARYRGEDRVTLCFLGDGASNAGIVFESLNMAALWKLPIVFIIENNEFAMGTRLEYHASDTELHKRGYPFGIPSERVDGMDILQVRRDAERIVEKVRTGGGPYLVEVMNYRFAGHGAADNDRHLYRTREEEEAAHKRDPILALEKVMKDRGVMTHEQMEAIDAEVIEQVERLYLAADRQPFAPPNAVYDHVYTDIQPERGH